MKKDIGIRISNLRKSMNMNKKQFAFSSFLIHFLYKATKNNKLFSKTNCLLKKKLIKRKLINEDLDNLFEQNGEWKLS